MIAATLPSVCAACRSRRELRVEQTLKDGSLTWAESFACSGGHGFEAKNVGLPPPAARKALMEAHGTFQVSVVAIPSGAKAIGLLAKVLDVAEPEVASALATLPTVVWEGTKLEAEFMKQALAKSGAAVTLEQSAGPVPPPRPSAKRARKG